MFLDIVLLIAGLIVIVKSADILINSSSSLARKLKIPTFIVGIVIVAFGTSAPELVIGIMSGITKTNELTLGNVIGSGFSNIALILGICAIIMPLKTEASVVKKEIPILIGVEMLLFGLLLFDKKLSLLDGIILMVCFVAFMTYIIVKTKMEQGNSLEESDSDTINQNNVENIPENQDRWIKIIPLLILSLIGLFVGGKLTVDNSSSIALSLGLTESFIGITIVAIATTLPELVASITAVRKKETGIVLGNCIGSNIFNILLVTGISATMNSIAFDTTLIIDFCLIIFLTLFVFFIALLRKKISRKVGVSLVSGFALYMAFKILSITVLSGII